jgi:hypothetical protein
VLAAAVGVVGLHIQPTGFYRLQWGHGGSPPEHGSDEEPQPTGGTMDTSRGLDGSSDSRADRQLRPTQGRHIMKWRQTWRQRWRPTRPPSPRHHHDPRPRRQPVVHGCRVNPSSTAGDHVLDRRSLQGSPCRQGALTNGPTVVSAASSLPSGWGSGRGARSRRRPPAWRLEHQAGAALGHRNRTDRGLETAGRPTTSYLCIAIPSIQPYPPRTIRLTSHSSDEPRSSRTARDSQGR